MICVCREADLRAQMSRLFEKIPLEAGYPATDGNELWLYEKEVGSSFQNGLRITAFVMEPGTATISKTKLLALLGDKDLGRLLLLRTMADACYCLLEFETRDYGRDMGRAYWIFEREKVADITYRPPAPSADSDLRARIEEYVEKHDATRGGWFWEDIRRILAETK